jgi:alpha-glucosidase
MLAAPVLEPGAATRRVELPSGEWVDIWTGNVHRGGGTVEMDVELGTLPLLLQRDRALIVDPSPLEGRGHAWPPPELDAWSWAEPGAQSQAELYLDDGITRMHEQGAYCRQLITVRDHSVDVERLGGAWPASRVRAAVPAPGRIGAVVGR